MKKMQCEVCGSTSIKKVDDSIFECQSCGVQYSKEELQKLLVEITGTVKIDRSDEIENTIKRAEQFENEGDSQKAKEYYNKALDIDAENEIAYQRLEEISKNQILEEYYIVEATVNPADNVKKFLRELAGSENVACDIYKEITIKNIYQKYHTFVYSKYDIKCEWSAIVCKRYYENETVYKTVYRNGREYKEPKTELVEKIQRIPRNGVYKYQAEGLVVSSQELSQAIRVLDEYNKNAILDDFATLQSDKCKSYIINRVNPQEVAKEEGKYYYKGYELDLQVNHDLYKRNGEKIVDNATEGIIPDLLKKIGGDFYENPNNTVTYRSSNEKYVCVPVQVIEYDYKGIGYFAVSDLVSQTTSISKLYPSDAVLESSNEELSNMDKKLQRTSESTKIGYGFCLLGFACAIPGGIIEAENLIIGGMICIFISLILLLFGVWENSKMEKNLAKSTSEKIVSIYSPRKLALSDSYSCFFAVLDSNGSYTDAKNAVRDVLIVEDTVVRLSKAGDNKYFSLDTNDSLNEKEGTVLEHQEELLRLKKKNKIAIGFIPGGFALEIWGIVLSVDADGLLGVLVMLTGVVFMAVVGPVMLAKNSKRITACNEAIKEARESMMK